MVWFPCNIGGGGSSGIANILKGTTEPASSIGDNGQLYLKYGNYEKHYFMDNKIVVVENKDDATDLKLYVVGLTKDSSGIAITDTDLLAYLSDITSGYLKGCSTYDTADSTTQTGILAIANLGSGLVLNTYIPGWTQYKTGTFYGVIDLTESPVSVQGTPPYQPNHYVDPDAFTDGGILDSFAKVNGQWQDLIGTDIDAIQSGGSLEIGCPKIFDDADRIDGKYIDPQDGTEKTDDPDSACTDFIDISSYDFFIVDYNCTWTNHYYNAFYDSSKQYIQDFSLTPNTLNFVDDIPSNAKYVRISWSKATETNVYGATLGIKPIPTPSPIVFKNYAKFDGSQGIILPFNINADYKVTVCFYETNYSNDSAVIGNTDGASFSHLTEYSNQWYTSSGTSEENFGSWAGNVEHTYITNNGNGKNEFDGVEVTNYTPTTTSGIYTVGCRGQYSNLYSGYIKSYKIESISTGDAICELKPCLFDNETPCLYDTVNKKFYYADGLTVMDIIPTN